MAKSKNFVMLRKKNPKNIEETLSEKALSERRAKALDLRMAGASYMDIVKAKIGYSSPSHVSHDMRKIVDEFRYEQPEDVLILDLARLDELQKYLTFAFRSGNYQYASLIMNVMRFRRETLGITPEVIESRRLEKAQVTNNGIMVIQGANTADYLEDMMRASGASSDEVLRQRERLQLESGSSEKGSSQNNSQEIVDAEVVNSDTDNYVDTEVHSSVTDQTDNPIDDLTQRISVSAQEQERLASERDRLETVPLNSPLLNVDIVESEEIDNPPVKKLRIRIKQPDTNQAATAGVVYRAAPRKPQVRLRKVQTEELTTSTVIEEI